MKLPGIIKALFQLGFIGQVRIPAHSGIKPLAGGPVLGSYCLMIAGDAIVIRGSSDRDAHLDQVIREFAQQSDLEGLVDWIEQSPLYQPLTDSRFPIVLYHIEDDYIRYKAELLVHTNGRVTIEVCEHCEPKPTTILKDFCREHGITHFYKTPDSPVTF